MVTDVNEGQPEKKASERVKGKGANVSHPPVVKILLTFLF